MTRTERTRWLTVLVVCAGLIAASCGDDDGDAASDTSTGAAATDGSEGASSDEPVADAAGSEVEGEIFVTGSSTVEPITVRVAELFEDVAPGVNVSVEGPGTGDGFQAFCAGEADISDASRPIKDEEAEACAGNGIEYVELKVAIDGLAVLTNPANEAVECLTFEDLYALLGPESTGLGNWSDAQDLAAELGSTTTFPEGSLDISAPGTESGTYDSFIEIVFGDIASARVEAGALDEEDAESLRPDYASSADDNTIITNIEGSDTSLGFVGLAFATEAGDAVKIVEVDGGDGCVAPTEETAASGEYPIARDLFIYVSSAAIADNPAVVPFVEFYLEAGLDEAAAEVGYVELADDAKAETRDAWAAAGA